MTDMIVTIALGLFVVAMLPMVVAPFLKPTSRPMTSSAPASPRPIRRAPDQLRSGSEQPPIAA